MRPGLTHPSSYPSRCAMRGPALPPLVQGCPEPFPDRACSPAASQAKPGSGRNYTLQCSFPARKGVRKTHRSSELPPAIINDAFLSPITFLLLLQSPLGCCERLISTHRWGAAGARAPRRHGHGAGFALLPFQCHPRSSARQTGVCDSSTHRKTEKLQKYQSYQDEGFVRFN